MKNRSNLIILSIFLIWRTALFVISFISLKYFPFQPRFPYSDIFLIPSGFPKFLWSFANFDGVHYLTIINHGYSAQYTQVFFPFYPYLIRIISSTFYYVSPIVVGIGLSNIFFLLSLFLFNKLINLDNIKNAFWAIIFLISFPTSFYFGSFYTESLFFLLVLSSFYFARKNKWLAASFLGTLASMTRLNGIFLLPSLLVEWLLQKKVPQTKISNLMKEALKCPALYIVPLGLLIYMAYLQLTFHDALYFWHAQPVFGAERSGSQIVLLHQVFYRYYKILTTVQFGSEVFFISFLECFFTIVSILCLIGAYRKKIRLSYLVFSVFSILIPTLTGTLSSMPRYVLLAFPIYVYLSSIKSALLKMIIIALSLILLTVLTSLFARGHWV